MMLSQSVYDVAKLIVDNFMTKNESSIRVNSHTKMFHIGEYKIGMRGEGRKSLLSVYESMLRVDESIESSLLALKPAGLNIATYLQDVQVAIGGLMREQLLILKAREKSEEQDEKGAVAEAVSDMSDRLLGIVKNHIIRVSRVADSTGVVSFFTKTETRIGTLLVPELESVTKGNASDSRAKRFRREDLTRLCSDMVSGYVDSLGERVSSKAFSSAWNSIRDVLLGPCEEAFACHWNVFGEKMIPSDHSLKAFDISFKDAPTELKRLEEAANKPKVLKLRKAYSSEGTPTFVLDASKLSVGPIDAWEQFISRVDRPVEFCLAVTDLLLPWTDSRPILTLFGNGGDGKSVVISALADTLESTAHLECNIGVDALKFRLGLLQTSPIIQIREATTDKSGSTPKSLFSDTVVKRISGNDEVVGEEKFGASWAFKPRSKLIADTNHRPSIDMLKASERSRANVFYIKPRRQLVSDSSWKAKVKEQTPHFLVYCFLLRLNVLGDDLTRNSVDFERVSKTRDASIVRLLAYQYQVEVLETLMSDYNIAGLLEGDCVESIDAIAEEILMNLASRNIITSNQKSMDDIKRSVSASVRSISSMTAGVIEVPEVVKMKAELSPFIRKERGIGKGLLEFPQFRFLEDALSKDAERAIPRPSYGEIGFDPQLRQIEMDFSADEFV